MRTLGILALACLGCASATTSTRDGEPWTTRAAERGAVRVERAAPAEVPIGRPFQYELRVRNVTKDPVEEVVVTERAPEGFSIEGAEPKPDALEGGVARWSLGTLRPDETRTIRVTGTPSRAGDLACSCEVTCRTPVYGGVRVVEPKLALAWEAPAAALVGETVKLVYTVSNPGTGRAKQVVVNATLPEGMERAEGGRDLRFELAELAAGASRSFQASVRATRTGTFAIPGGATAEGGLSASTPEIPLPVTQPVLAVALSGPSDWMLDRPLACAVTVRNSGDGEARDTVVELALPEGAALAGAGDAKVAAGSARWSFGTLAPGAERKAEFTLRVAQPGTVRTGATATAFCAAAATATLETRVVGVAALLLDVADAVDPVAVGAEATYEIAVTNQGTAAATNVAVACALEATMEFASAGGATEAKAEGGAVVFAPLASLERGATARWRVLVRAAREGDARFKVSLASDSLERPVEETEATRFFK